MTTIHWYYKQVSTPKLWVTSQEGIKGCLTRTTDPFIRWSHPTTPPSTLTHKTSSQKVGPGIFSTWVDTRSQCFPASGQGPVGHARSRRTSWLGHGLPSNCHLHGKKWCIARTVTPMWNNNRIVGDLRTYCWNTIGKEYVSEPIVETHWKLKSPMLNNNSSRFKLWTYCWSTIGVTKRDFQECAIVSLPEWFSTFITWLQAGQSSQQLWFQQACLPIFFKNTGLHSAG